jgi:outer membrane biosynthesis protein TonB
VGLPRCDSRVPELKAGAPAPSAAQREYSGKVKLALTVETSGYVSAVRPVGNNLHPVGPVSGPPSREVDNLAAAARRWRFVPQPARCVWFYTAVLS